MASGGRRAGSGRKPKATELKKLAGTLRKDRGGKNVPVTDSVAMVAPDYLGDLEQLLFGSIAGLLEAQGRASPNYVDTVALLAQRIGQIRRYTAALECEGDIYESRTATGGIMIRKRPEVQMLSEAMRHAHALLSELMLTPASAMRLMDGHEPTAGAWDDFD